MYRKGSKGIEVNCKNVGVSRNFYGASPGASADEEITAIEGDYARLISNLAGWPEGQSLHDDRIPSLIAHLCMRSRSLRESMTEWTVRMTHLVHSHLKDPRTIRGSILTNDLAERAMDIAMSSKRVPKRDRARVRALLQSLIPGVLHGMEQETGELIDEMMEFAHAEFPRAIREGHIQALRRDPNASPRGTTYTKFNWFVVTSPSTLVLGDTACFFETRGKRRFKPIDDAEDDTKYIFLPIAREKMLVGTLLLSPPELDFRLLNKAAVRCSDDFFVCSSELQSTSGFPASIGRWSGILTEAEIQAQIGELQTKWESDKKTVSG